MSFKPAIPFLILMQNSFAFGKDIVVENNSNLGEPSVGTNGILETTFDGHRGVDGLLQSSEIDEINNLNATVRAKTDRRNPLHTNNIPNKHQGHEQYEPYRCSLYLAESSIPHAGFGVYTVRDVKEGDNVLPYSDAPSIPTCNDRENGIEDKDWNHVDYLWSGKGGLAEFECNSVSVSVMTFGSLCNFHTYLTNVYPIPVDYDDTMVDRYSDPGAGAFSYHGGYEFEATRDIMAGDEIFADYGEQWLDYREGTFADNVPRYDDFEEGAQAFNLIQSELNANNVNITEGVIKTLKNIVTLMDQRVGATLPGTKESFENISKKNNRNRSRKSYEAAKTLAEQTIHKKSIQWIKENGICLDLIRPGLSTITGAGRGAFAQGYISSGSIISPAPLLNIVDKEKMDIYNLSIDEETGELEEVTEDSEVIGKQLLVNYCFSHKESRLLLCPQSNMILMNHCSHRMRGGGQCRDNGPNAKVQWASGWDPDTANWLDMDMDEIRGSTAEGMRGLSFEVIATRDIFPGEEVMIDYGENWEEAWQSHINHWKAPAASEFTYVPIKTMIAQKQLEIRTKEELEENPYPSNIQTVCYYPGKGHDDEEEENDEEEGEDMVMESGKYYKTANGVETEKFLVPCQVLQKPSQCQVDGTDSYVVTIESENLMLNEYPEESITFRTTKEMSDVTLPHAFRHFIEVDEALFPESWKY